MLWPCHTTAYRILTYARVTLGNGCICFKHGRIRWHTVREKFLKKFLVRIYVIHRSGTWSRGGEVGGGGGGGLRGPWVRWSYAGPTQAGNRCATHMSLLIAISSKRKLYKYFCIFKGLSV